MALDHTEIERYSRQLILPRWGEKQQLQLKSSRIGVSVDLPSAALYLLAAGVETIFLIGKPEESNEWLNRQITALGGNVLQYSGETLDFALISSSFAEDLPNSERLFVVDLIQKSIQFDQSPAVEYLATGNDSSILSASIGGCAAACLLLDQLRSSPR